MNAEENKRTQEIAQMPDMTASETVETGPDKPETAKNIKKKHPGIRLIIKLAVIAGIVYALLTFVVGIYPVHGTGNFPMLKDGDLAFTQKIGGYATGDMVSYELDGKRYFSRIVGVSGDRIDITEAGLLVNEIAPAEEIFYETHDTTNKIQYPCYIPEGFVFLLNDFRDDENDSRSYGIISEKDLDGKVIFIFRRRKI